MTSRTVADCREVDSPGVNLMPPAVFFACLLTGGVSGFFFPHPIPLFPAVLRTLLGLGIGISGFVMMCCAHEAFERIGTSVPTNRPASVFVVHGAYKLSRNPMYVGGSAFFLGLGLVSGSLWMIAAYLPLGLYLSLYVVPREEAYMERAFGEDYREYRSQVRRWL